MMPLLLHLVTSRRTWVVALVCGLVLAIFWSMTGYPQGVVAAHQDRARGHYEVKVFGYPLPESGDYARLLRERYGVTVNVVAGCVVSEHQVEYIRGYNAVSERRLIEQHGRDIFAECWAEAEKRWRAEHPQGAGK